MEHSPFATPGTDDLEEPRWRGSCTESAKRSTARAVTPEPEAKEMTKPKQPSTRDAPGPDSADGLSRREMLKIAGAAAALGVAGCERKPRRKIVSRATTPFPAKGSAAWAQRHRARAMTGTVCRRFMRASH